MRRAGLPRQRAAMRTGAAATALDLVDGGLRFENSRYSSSMLMGESAEMEEAEDP